MTMTPESLPENNNIIDFRAPPPSPVASGRRSSVRNEDFLSEFLEHSLKVPDLILPDRVFPRQKSTMNPPKLDFQCLTSLQNEPMMTFLECVALMGCFEVINHGISDDLINSVLLSGGGIFRISTEKRKLVTRSLERPYGFEEVHEEEQTGMSVEEFVWCRDEGFKRDMEGILPIGYSNFSEKMEKLWSAIEGVAEKILQLLQQNTSPTTGKDAALDGEFGSICYIHKHCRMGTGDESVNSLSYDIIRMLIRGSEFPHALCLHLCNGFEEFHVYSKKGWVSFHPDKDSLVITFGDKLQAWSNGQFKHVVGRPIFKGVDRDHMSVAFLYSPSNVTTQTKIHEGQNISLSQQIVVAIVFTLLYRFMICVYESI